MDFNPQPWQLYLVILAGWVNRQQQIVIEYLKTENQILRETHGKKRILLSDDQRRRLAVKGKILGRNTLERAVALHPVLHPFHAYPKAFSRLCHPQPCSDDSGGRSE